VNVIVPVGLIAPERTAVSVNGVPTLPLVGETVPVKPGVALLTAMVLLVPVMVLSPVSFAVIV
jgi:hypothetical protein